jgi:hypothetical protein
MFKLKLGSALIGFSLLFILISPASIFVMWPFVALGIVLAKSGYDEVKKDKLTEQHGESYYGMIETVQETGQLANGQKEYRAKVLVYLRDEVCEYEEIIGFDSRAYRKGDYVLCKYFRGDINILNILQDYEIPPEILAELHKAFDFRFGPSERVRRELNKAYKNGKIKQPNSNKKKNEKWQIDDKYDW